MDGSKYFWNSLSYVKFDAESESEVRFVLRSRGIKSQAHVQMKTSQNVRLYEHPWMNITFPRIVQHNLISTSRKITFSKRITKSRSCTSPFQDLLTYLYLRSYIQDLLLTVQITYKYPPRRKFKCHLNIPDGFNQHPNLSKEP